MMSQALSAGWQSAIAITPEHVNATGGISKDRKEVREFLDQLQAAVGFTLGTVSPAHVQCKIGAMNTVSKSWEEPVKDIHWFVSGSRQVHLWLKSGSGFGKLLCELAFGGSGKATSNAGVDAPPVKIEERLAGHILALMSSNISKVLAEAAGCDFIRVNDPDPEKLEHFAAPQRLIEIRLTISVLQRACEITAYFVADEIKDLLLEKPSVKKNISPYDSVKKCKFELRSLLPPDEVSLATVLALQPGSQLSLSLTVDSPIMVVCGDTLVFEGECDPSGDRIDIYLSSRDGVMNPQDSAAPPTASGSFH